MASAAVWPLHALGHRRAARAWPGNGARFFPHVEGKARGQPPQGGKEGRKGARSHAGPSPKAARTGGAPPDAEGPTGMEGRQLT